ncbi:MAG: filamentous hemagglutinin N-terminal domain-containing protein, partial [Planctomycetaceae bacterium]
MKSQTYPNSRNGLDVRTALVFLVITILALSAAVYAGPHGAKVVRGKVQFTQQGDTLVIKASNNSIINFRSFNIPAGETVRFVLPSSSSRVLSRVTGGAASQIDGMLVCNGRLYLTNYAGVNFGSTAVVNAAALYAVAGNISDRDFLRKADRFSGIAGAVTNDGMLQAQAVHLVGTQVANSGSIIVPAGVVTMTAASGEVYLVERDGHFLVKVAGASASPAPAAAAAAPLPEANPTNPLAVGDMYSLAVQNTGTVKAGRVAVGGEGAKVDVSGTIDAANPTGRGGDVRITGQQISVAAAAIDASGATGGGEIVILASNTDKSRFAKSSVFVSSDSIISASAGVSGNGGRITVKADDLAMV